ncbi:MAG: 3-hydroxyacyl-CoA dehydrogenase/enoyl-CoA hydratase family protein [Cyanobacteriota bacterium]
MNKVAVIGAGIMGCGIAQCLLMAGISVDLVDVNPEVLETAQAKLYDSFEDALQKGLITLDQKNESLNKIETMTSIDYISEDVSLVIEAAYESIDVKREIFESLDQKCNNDVIFATNTSCISVTELSKMSVRPDRFVGTHFFFPAERNKLLEIIPARDTSDNTLNKVILLAELLDKVYIIVEDTPGFCVNRFFVPLLNEAVKLLENPKYKNDIYTINYALKEAFKAPFGPFEIMNLTGTALAMHACNELSERLGSFYKPCNLLQEYGHGNTVWEIPEVSKFKDMESAAFHDTPELKRHFQSIVMAICANMLDEDIAEVTDINLGAKIGLGWKTGPFDLMNELGPSKVYRYIEDISSLYSSIKVPEFLDEVDLWETENIRYSTENNVAKIQLWRPDALNALSENLLKELENNLQTAIEDENVKLITINGSPKVFSAGADLKFFIHCLEKSNFEAIYEYTELAHKVLLKISASPKPVIALIDGIALGGGLELALACHFILATEKSNFRFPETSIGLFPGFGGTQKLPKRVGFELAKYLILLGINVTAKEALDFGLVDKVVKNKLEARDFIFNIVKDNDISNESLIMTYKEMGEISEEIQKNIKLLRNVDLLISRKLISSRAKEMIQAFENKPIQAITIANNLIDKSKKISIEEGMNLEMSYVKEIFKQPQLVNSFKDLLNIKRPKSLHD